MRTPVLRLITMTVLLAVGLMLGASAAGRGAVAAPSANAPVKRYIVVLSEPPLAQYTGGVKGLAPTAVGAVAAGGPLGRASVHLDTTSTAARAYATYLAQRQASVMRAVRAFAPEFNERDWQYQYVLNGFVAQLTPVDVERVRATAGVRAVFPTEEMAPEMDATKNIVHTLEAFEAMGGSAEAGAGARVATLEAGNAPMHPFFNDVGMPPPPAGFPQAKYYARDGTVGELDPTFLVNNKVVAFKPVYRTMTTSDITQLNAGLGVQQHGTHVAGTMTGRWGSYPLELIGPNVEMGGIAPMAHLFTYPYDGTTAEMIKAFELMVEDEIDAVNLSLGTTSWLLDTPEMYPLSLAMSGATDAGIVVVASAGNAGSNGRTSLSAAWKYNEDVTVVGNTSTTGRYFLNLAVDSAGAPESLKKLNGGLLGEKPPAPVTGEAVYRDDGGCAVSDTVSGKIAVIERFLANGTAVGTCDFASRANFMKQSGAIGIVYVYYDRAAAASSPTVIALPGFALGSGPGKALVDWLKAGHATTVTIENEGHRVYDLPADILQGSSSRGPGLNWSIKPDLSAPGSSVYSSMMEDPNTSDNDPRPSRAVFRAIGGTSMATPHVTGAAALIRSVHKTWTARQVKSALVTTVDPVVMVGAGTNARPADPTEAGPGRLNVAAAMNPGTFLSPPKLSFGKLAPGASRTIEVTAEAATSRPITWDIAVESHAGDATAVPSVTELTVQPGHPETFSVTLTTTDSTVDEHWGYVSLTERPAPPTIYFPALAKDAVFGEAAPMAIAGPATTARPQADATGKLRTLHLAYYAFVDVPSTRKNVLIVDWTYGNTADYIHYYTETLKALGLTYTVWGLGETEEHTDDETYTAHPPYKVMAKHDLVLFNGNMSPRSMNESGVPGMFQYQNLVLGGGNFLIAGQGTQGWWRYLNRGTRYADNANNRTALPDTWPFAWAYDFQTANQNVGCEMCLARYFAGFTPAYTSTLSGRLLVPYPSRPDEPDMNVTLVPHPDADGPFDYDLDISTGTHAKDGAAGNQYRFASGDVARNYKGTDIYEQASDLLGDIEGAEGVMGRYSPLASPMWSYEVSNTLKVVGTYIAGKQHPEAKVPWNAMYWGFGLEGVGKNGDDTASRDRLLGDTFNFLAKNIKPTALVAALPGGETQVKVSLGATAAPVKFVRAELAWGDGRTESVPFTRPTAAGDLAFRHSFAATQGGREPVRITLFPVPGTAAPVHVSATLQ